MDDCKVSLRLATFLCLLSTCTAAPLYQSTTDVSYFQVFSFSPVQFIYVFTTALMLCGFLVFGCTCCYQKKFQCGRNQVVHEGHVSTLSGQSEFAIFPPCSSVINLQPVHTASDYLNEQEKVIFEPLPVLLPKGDSHHNAKPAHFDALLKKKESLHDWFDDPTSNFARHQLQYVEEIGNGWFGCVVRGKAHLIVDGQEKTPVIVKILREEATPSEHLYFLHDTFPYRDLQHPNVVRLLGRCLEADPFLLIMENTVTDLKTYLTTHADNLKVCNISSSEQLLQMTCDIASGLSHMHENNFIHMDFAAHNCFIAMNNVIKIGDYGLSFDKFREDYYCVGDVVLPIRWLSPEAMEVTDGTIKTHDLTKKTNVWSLGVTVWEILNCGTLPYSELSDQEVLEKVILDQSVQLKSIHNICSPISEICHVMKLCWKPENNRPKCNEIENILRELKEFGILPESLSSFDERWNSLEPKVESPNQNVQLTFENDFVLHNSSNGFVAFDKFRNLSSSSDDLVSQEFCESVDSLCTPSLSSTSNVLQLENESSQDEKNKSLSRDFDISVVSESSVCHEVPQSQVVEHVVLYPEQTEYYNKPVVVSLVPVERKVHDELLVSDCIDVMDTPENAGSTQGLDNRFRKSNSMSATCSFSSNLHLIANITNRTDALHQVSSVKSKFIPEVHVKQPLLNLSQHSSIDEGTYLTDINNDIMSEEFECDMVSDIQSNFSEDDNELSSSSIHEITNGSTKFVNSIDISSIIDNKSNSQNKFIPSLSECDHINSNSSAHNSETMRFKNIPFGVGELENAHENYKPVAVNDSEENIFSEPDVDNLDKRTVAAQFNDDLCISNISMLNEQQKFPTEIHKSEGIATSNEASLPFNSDIFCKSLKASHNFSSQQAVETGSFGALQNYNKTVTNSDFISSNKNQNLQCSLSNRNSIPDMFQDGKNRFSNSELSIIDEMESENSSSEYDLQDHIVPDCQMSSCINSFEEINIEDIHDVHSNQFHVDNFDEDQLEQEEVLKIDIETNEAILVDTSESLIGFVPSRSIELLQECECISPDEQPNSIYDMINNRNCWITEDINANEYNDLENHAVDTASPCTDDNINSNNVLESEYDRSQDSPSSLKMSSFSDSSSDLCLSSVNRGRLVKTETVTSELNGSSEQHCSIIHRHEPAAATVESNNTVVIEGEEIFAGMPYYSNIDFKITDYNCDIQPETCDLLNHNLDVSSNISPSCSVSSTPNGDFAYTPDFESESESHSSCSSTSGSFECIHNRFKDANNIALDQAIDLETPSSPENVTSNPLRVFSKTWDSQATPDKGLLKSPEKKVLPIRKSVSFHEDPQLVFQYPPASDSSEEEDLYDPIRDATNHIDYVSYADWELQAGEDDEIPEEMIEIEEESESNSPKRPNRYKYTNSSATLYTITGYLDEDFDTDSSENLVTASSCDESKSEIPVERTEKLQNLQLQSNITEETEINQKTDFDSALTEDCCSLATPQHTVELNEDDKCSINVPCNLASDKNEEKHYETVEKSVLKVYDNNTDEGIGTDNHSSIAVDNSEYCDTVNQLEKVVESTDKNH